MRRNWYIAICGFWSIVELGFSVEIGRTQNIDMGFFEGFKFKWVEFILLTFGSSPSIGVRVGEESLEDKLRIKSIWTHLKDTIWILRCFGLEYRVSSKS